MKMDLRLEDTTLRDGEQAPGVAFDTATKREILDALIAAGVRSIEVGIPAMGGEELKFVSSCTERQDEARLVAWHRGVRSELEATLDLGFRSVHIGLPTSGNLLRASVKKTRGWLLETARALVCVAKDRGAFVSISAEDVGRTEPGFLQEYAAAVAAAGADRIRLSDTIGVLDPQAYGQCVRAVCAAVSVPVQCHTHNDFGLATANTLAGLQAGAQWFHVTVNGIGERAGMPDIAQVAVALKCLYDRDLGIDLSHLSSLSRLVARASRREPMPWHPVVGGNVFAHESGIHANGMLRDSSSFEPFPPELVGGMRSYVVGKHSGRANLRRALSEEGVDADESLLGPCLEKVRQKAVETGGAVTPSLLREIYLNLSNGTGRHRVED
jgi:homocitrate synthase NifV